MGISFFKVPNHRVFHYEPRYWDERKERREMVKNETLREKALREGKEWKDESYRPGMYISGKFQEQARNNRRGSRTGVGRHLPGASVLFRQIRDDSPGGHTITGYDA